MEEFPAQLTGVRVLHLDFFGRSLRSPYIRLCGGFSFSSAYIFIILTPPAFCI